MQQSRLYRDRAFTLIELSIVLVIIGLIVGGVLVGKDLIKAAKLRKVVTEVDQIKAAALTFRLKYNCLPGDCHNASTLFSGESNGDGNKLIGAFPGVNYGEVWRFWTQLSAAGLVSGTYSGAAGPNTIRHAVPGTNVMASSTRDSMGFTVLNWAGYDNTATLYNPSTFASINENVILVGTTGNGATACCGHSATANNWETYAPAFTAADAYSIDSKVDDGRPASGKILHPFAVFYVGCVTSANPATAAYDVTAGVEACSLFVKSGI